MSGFTEAESRDATQRCLRLFKKGSQLGFSEITERPIIERLHELRYKHDEQFCDCYGLERLTKK